jgi:hypothetical protein
MILLNFAPVGWVVPPLNGSIMYSDPVWGTRVGPRTREDYPPADQRPATTNVRLLNPAVRRLLFFIRRLPERPPTAAGGSGGR